MANAIDANKVDTTPDIISGGTSSYTQALQRLALQASSAANLANTNSSAITTIEAEIAGLPTPPTAATTIPLPDAAAGNAGSDITEFAQKGHVHPDHYQPYALTPEPDSGSGSAGTTLDEFAMGDHVHPITGSVVAPTWTFKSTAVSYAILTTDMIVLFTGGGAQTLTLPTAASVAGKVYIMRNPTVSNLTIATTGGQTIDGSGATTILAGGVLRVFSDGSNWYSW